MPRTLHCSGKTSPKLSRQTWLQCIFIHFIQSVKDSTGRIYRASSPENSGTVLECGKHGALKDFDVRSPISQRRASITRLQRNCKSPFPHPGHSEGNGERKKKSKCAPSLCFTTTREQGSCYPASLVNPDGTSLRGKNPHRSGAEEMRSAKIFREAKDITGGS